MKAFVLDRLFDLTKEDICLRRVELPVPSLAENEILVRIKACGVCHTELDEISGRTPPLFFPVVLGHQAVGEVVEIKSETPAFRKGERVGIAWIYSACRQCKLCRAGFENLCPDFKATGRDVNGGYAEYMAINQDYAYSIPEAFSDIEAAPLLCAGAIGYRSLLLADILDGDALGLTGFGASAHIVLKLVKATMPDTKVATFARNAEEREFALKLGADWAGDTTDTSPFGLNAVIDTTPAWKPVLEACRNLTPGGRLVINAIRKEPADKSELMNLSYENHLWMEKEIKSVANITSGDVRDFLQLAAKYGIVPETETYPFEDANKALNDLKNKRIRGGKVLVF
ncbi:MAG: zinc-dependent alcohol dehydrogenase family protein [Bacteroidetes bacterium]|nr:zinc-dependent alcohol dehydrogenase family protein [Bacteroidota bacterium]